MIEQEAYDKGYKQGYADRIEMEKALRVKDCISREAVDTLVDELARAISDERCCISRGRSTATIMQDILELPPVTPQPKTGRWIDGEKTRWKCSRCGYGVLDWNTTPYCPNCGAKMQEVEK